MCIKEVIAKLERAADKIVLLDGFRVDFLESYQNEIEQCKVNIIRLEIKGNNESIYNLFLPSIEQYLNRIDRLEDKKKKIYKKISSKELRQEISDYIPNLS